jgi:hypothetical protein
VALAGHVAAATNQLLSPDAFTSPMKQQQSVLTHTILQTENPALLDIWFINTPFIKVLHPEKRNTSYIFVFKKKT